MDYQVGKNYVVPCAEIRLKEDGRVYAIPVFEQAHMDTQFNFHTGIITLTADLRSTRV